MRRTVGLTLGTALLVSAAACGTTVRGVAVSGGTAGQGTGGLSAGLPAGTSGPAADLANPAAPGGTTAAGGPVTPGAPGQPGTAPAGAAPNATVPRAGSPGSGRGYTATTVYVGFPTNNDASSAAKGLGLAGLDFGDQIAQANAVVADLNRHGGLLGRRVVAVIHDIKTADLETDASGQAQATCTALTQDHPVAAVVNVVAAIDLDTFYGCLAKARTPLFSAGFVPVDRAQLAAFAPYLYKLSAAEFDPFGPVWLDRLGSRRYFTGWDTANGAPSTTAPVKVGLLYADADPSRRIFRRLRSELAARGLTVAADVAYDVSSLSNESSAMSNAVLTFRSAGVTHVLADASDVELFMAAASSQHYSPRYGMNSYLAPQLQAGNTPSQLAGSIGVGWIPEADVAAAQSPGPMPGERACRGAMQAAGQSLTSYGVALIAFSLCDGAHLFADAATAAGSTDAGAVRTAMDRTGPGFRPALTFASGVSSSQAALPGAGRDFAWDTGCSCFRYLDAVNRGW